MYTQNIDDLCAKMNVVLEFVEGMKAQIEAIDEKLDSLTSDVSAMHADLRLLMGKPVLEVYQAWADAFTQAVGSTLPEKGE